MDNRNKEVRHSWDARSTTSGCHMARKHLTVLHVLGVTISGPTGSVVAEWEGGVSLSMH